MAVNNSLTKEKPHKLGFTSYLTQDAVNKQISKVVGGANSTRFISSIISAVQANPSLQECSNQSILSAALQGEALNLPPSPQLGYFYMIPFDNRKKGIKEAQFQLSAKGYKQLAMRSGQYRDIDVFFIHEGEYLGRDRYTGKQKFEFIEDDEERESRPIIGYLAYFEMLNGFRKQLYWTRSKMEAHAEKYSMGYRAHKGYTFWEKDFDSMAEKTMIRQLLSKWGMLSTDMVKAYESDMGVIKEDGTVEHVDIIDSTAQDTTEPAQNEPQTTEAPQADNLPPTVEKTQETAENGTQDRLF